MLIVNKKNIKATLKMRLLLLLLAHLNRRLICELIVLAGIRRSSVGSYVSL